MAGRRMGLVVSATPCRVVMAFGIAKTNLSDIAHGERSNGAGHDVSKACPAPSAPHANARTRVADHAGEGAPYHKEETPSPGARRK